MCPLVKLIILMPAIGHVTIFPLFLSHQPVGNMKLAVYSILCIFSLVPCSALFITHMCCWLVWKEISGGENPQPGGRVERLRSCEGLQGKKYRINRVKLSRLIEDESITRRVESIRLTLWVENPRAKISNRRMRTQNRVP